VERILRLTLIAFGLLGVFVVLFSCGQASSPIEKKEKKGGVEQAAEQEPSAPDTPQEIRALSDKETIALGECQLHKMVEDRGQKATEPWMDEKVQEVEDAPKDAEVTSIQEDLLAEGYTCTPEEVQEVAAAQSASASAGSTAQASATTEPFTESVPVAIQAEMAYCDMKQFAKNEGLNFRDVEAEARTYMAQEGASWPETLEHVGVPHYVYCEMSGE
jgi:hypothetical protein